MTRRILILLTVIVFSYSICEGQETNPLTKEEIRLSIENNLKFESDNVERFLVYRGFIVQYNYVQKAPNFTIHKLNPEQISSQYGMKAKRRSNFFVDDSRLHSNSATNSDYRKSGYDRGHMVPAGDFYWDQLKKNETFVMSNITPQKPAINRGIWAFLENSIRQKIQSTKEVAYVITGAIFRNNNGIYIGRNNVGVPANIYKIIYCPEDSKMYAFLFDNSVEEISGNLTDYQVRVNDIEMITQEDFFDTLDDIFEEKIESAIIPFQ